MNIQSMRNDAYKATSTRLPVAVASAGKETAAATQMAQTKEVELQKKEITEITEVAEAKNQSQRKELTSSPLEAFEKAAIPTKGKIFNKSDDSEQKMEPEKTPQVSLYKRQQAAQQYSNVMQIEQAKMQMSQLGTSTDYKL